MIGPYQIYKIDPSKHEPFTKGHYQNGQDHTKFLEIVRACSPVNSQPVDVRLAQDKYGLLILPVKAKMRSQTYTADKVVRNRPKKKITVWRHRQTL